MAAAPVALRYVCVAELLAVARCNLAAAGEVSAFRPDVYTVGL